ncbi:hypothetical protein Tco_1405686 [Tanacetum coccineum]
MFDDLQYVQSLEKEVDELEFEKAEFSNEYDILLQECVSKDIMHFILRALANIYEQTELQCLYLKKIEECECLATRESLLGADESCLMEVLHESSYTDMMDSPCSLPSDAEAPLEDQPLPANASPTALSLGYVVDSNPDEDPDEDPEEDPEEDHADYPADGGDGDDEPSDDDDDDDDTDDEDEEPFEDEDDDEEEEHLASADYLLATRPIVDPVPSYGDTRH